MSCEAIDQDLDAYVDRELEPDALRAIRAHLAGCAACRGRVAERQADRSPPLAGEIIDPWDACPRAVPFRMPLDSVQTAPVPTQAMHWRKFRLPGSLTSFGRATHTSSTARPSLAPRWRSSKKSRR